MEIVKSKHYDRQYGTNFTLGDDKLPMTSSYYKDYIQSTKGKNMAKEGYGKSVIAKPPPCATNVLPREQFPTAYVATSTNRRDYRGCSASDVVYRERLRDLSSIKTLHLQTSVVFGPGPRGGVDGQFLSIAQEHYRNPADTTKELTKKGFIL